MTYNPNAAGKKGTIFGYPYSLNEADLILLPVPWDVTVSYGAGTSNAPRLILEESTQLDFSISNIKEAYKYPVALTAIDDELRNSSFDLRSKAEKLIIAIEENGELSGSEKKAQEVINRGCEEMVASVKEATIEHLKEGKVVGLVGGDHSTPLGLIEALGEIYDDFGILQIDAHMDLREAYEGFIYSHASIMKNALKESSVRNLVQVGIRDYCEEEESFAEELGERVEVFFDEEIKRLKWKKEEWPQQVDRMIKNLPSKVYISFDIDGLDPSLCPNTGTPVPGGLDYYEAILLMESVVRSGREIIGFDISETGNAVWDANVASRILFRLSALTGVSRGRISLI